MSQHQRITVKSAVMGGKPCIAGTRIPVALLLKKLGHGETIDALLGAYPGLVRDEIEAALLDAADAVGRSGMPIAAE